MRYTPRYSSGKNFNNLVVHGEYRNRTRNRKWDMILYGEFYAAGRDIGNYRAMAKMERSLGNWGNLDLGFENINRSPSDIFGRIPNFPFPVEQSADFGDENVTMISASLALKKWRARLSFQQYLVSNYTYFKGFKQADQFAPVFSFSRIGLNRQTRLIKNWYWYVDLYVQSVAGDAPLNLPVVYTRNRIAYEGKPFRNLVLSTGVDLRYYSPYKADNYSPLLGQFFYQEDRILSIRPDVAVYTNFRIRSFNAYVRVENLNTLTTTYGFGFKQNNLAASFYPNPGLIFRLGIFWNFVN